MVKGSQVNIIGTADQFTFFLNRELYNSLKTCYKLHQRFRNMNSLCHVTIKKNSKKIATEFL